MSRSTVETTPRTAPAARAGTHEEFGASRQLRGARILVVDDEPLARQMFTDLLEAQGFQVVTVARGEEAFSFLPEIELVLLDAMLPGRDGWSICREIKEQHDPFLPIIMVTGPNRPEDVVGPSHPARIICSQAIPRAGCRTALSPGCGCTGRSRAQAGHDNCRNWRPELSAVREARRDCRGAGASATRVGPSRAHNLSGSGAAHHGRNRRPRVRPKRRCAASRAGFARSSRSSKPCADNNYKGVPIR